MITTLKLTRLGVATAVATAAFTVAAAPFAPITPITIASAPTTLTTAVQGSNSGIVVSGTPTAQGSNNQQGTYTAFTLLPSSGSSPTLKLPSGIILTTGSAIIPDSNTINNYTTESGSGANAQLGALSASQGGTSTTFDANVLSFNFKLTDPTKNSVSAQFVFATEEFPTQSVTDIFGFFVDGVNYAKFSSGQLISNTPNNPTNFISNTKLYGIEYNGLTNVFTVVGLLGTPNADGTHTLTIGIADTSDDIFDSGVFIGNLVAGTAQNGGINPGPSVPEPESIALLAVAGAVAVATRRRKR